jgi:hypothetical protein
MHGFKNWEKYLHLSFKVSCLTHFKPPVGIQRQFSHINFQKMSYFRLATFFLKLKNTQKCGKMSLHPRFNHKMVNLGMIY